MAARALGPYHLGEQLGGHPLGEILAASRTDSAARLALLLSRAQAARDQRFRRLVRREASTLQAVDRPEIARLAEVGQQGEAFYLVYEAPRGVPLAARLATGPALSVPQVVTLVTSLAESLDAVPRHGGVHGALAPETVFVDEEAAPTLVGVGLLVAADEAGLSPSLPPGMDPAYAAPEQTEARRAIASADAFALGMLAHTLLTGVPASGPDDGPRPMAASTAGLDPFEALVAVLRRQIARDPSRRYASCVAFAAALAGVCSALTTGEAAVPTTVVEPPVPPTPEKHEPVRVMTSPAMRTVLQAEYEAARVTPHWLLKRGARGAAVTAGLMFISLVTCSFGCVNLLLPIFAGIFAVVFAAIAALQHVAAGRLDDDLRRGYVLKVTGPVWVRVIVRRNSTTFKLRLVTGRELQVDASLYHRLAQYADPKEPSLADRLIPTALQELDEYRVSQLTVLFAPSSGTLLEVRDAAARIVDHHDGYTGTTLDPDA